MFEILRKSTWLIIFGILGLIVFTALIIPLGFTVIEEYNNEKQYVKTDCIVRAVEYNDKNPKNEWSRCPSRCTLQHTIDGLKTFCEVSEFPCLKIVVDVTTKFGLKSAIIHENPTKMQKYGDCSTYFCDKDSVVNEKYVNKFKRTWGNIGQKYKCYYNMAALNSDDDDEQEHALLKLTYNTAEYVNSIFWPTLVGTFSFFAIVLGIFMKFRSPIERENRRYNKSMIEREKLNQKNRQNF